MKVKAFLILFLGILCCTFCTFAYEKTRSAYESESDSDILQHSRVYVQSGQIHIQADGLFVEIEGTLYQVAQICQDEDGFYVPYTAYWKYCSSGHPNPPWRWRCQVCKEIL